MELKKLGEEEVVKKNYEYLLLAQENGFFQDGYDKEDIATCTDWIITWWIDEIGDKKKDKDKFVQEILPTFKRWFSNGVDSTGVGRYYETLKMAERNGIKINEGAFECISCLTRRTDSSLNQEYNSYESISDHFKTKEIMDNLKRFNKSGIPLCYPLADYYDMLIKLEEQGEKIDFDTFMFFYTAGYKTDGKKLGLYDDKKYIEERYGYSTCNADEVLKLMDWLGYGGYNSNYVNELEKRIEKYDEVISKNKKLDRSIDRISRRLNQNVSLSYYELDEQGNKTLNKISGTLLSCDENGITISYQNPETHDPQSITIEDNDRSLIARVSCNGVSLYESRTLKEREMIQKLKAKIGYLKSEDVLSKYVDKFGSIEGIAYLKKFAPEFIEHVNKEQFPIDNLFALCFENIAWISTGRDSINDVLQHVLYAYNGIMSGQFEALNNTNFGYPLNKFLSEDSQKVIQRICNYVISSELKADLPEMPTTPITPVSNDSQKEQQSEQRITNAQEILLDAEQDQEIEMSKTGRIK